MRLAKLFGLTLALALAGAGALGQEAAGQATTGQATTGRDAGKPSAETSDAEMSDIDKLYARLALTQIPEEAQGIVGEIDALRQQSGSDTADLLMSRARKAREAADPALVRQLFDALVDLDPDWSQGFAARAGARFENGDLDGAMADLAQTLKREPRDIGALAGLGAILLDSGDPEGALKVYDRALALAPAYAPVKEARLRAQNQVWSRSP